MVNKTTRKESGRVAELMSLFPEGSLQYVTHDNLGLLYEDEWLDHIRKPCHCVNMSGVKWDEVERMFKLISTKML